MSTSTSKRVKRGLISVLAIVGVFAMSTAGADAAYNGTYVYSKKLFAGVPACGAMNCPYGPGYIIPDRTPFAMVCYNDGPYKYGNYGSTRWFRGFFSGISGQVYVHSSYVYNQVPVRHC